MQGRRGAAFRAAAQRRDPFPQQLDHYATLQVRSTIPDVIVLAFAIIAAPCLLGGASSYRLPY